jgi:hypothetical protein
MQTSFTLIRWTAALSFRGYIANAGPFMLELHRPEPASAGHWLLKAYLIGSIFRCRLWAMDCVDHRAAHLTARLMAAEPELFMDGDWAYQQHRVALQQLNRKGAAR